MTITKSSAPLPAQMATPTSVPAAAPPTWNDRVTTCDGLTGRISFVWKKGDQVYYRVSFPPGSPYLDDWTVYRQREVKICPPTSPQPSTPQNSPAKTS